MTPSFPIGLGHIIDMARTLHERRILYARAPGEIDTQKREADSFVSLLEPYVADSACLPEEVQAYVGECLSAVKQIQHRLSRISSSKKGLAGSFDRHLKRAQLDPAELQLLWKRVDSGLEKITQRIQLADLHERTLRRLLDSIWSGKNVPPPPGLPGTFRQILDSEEMRKWESEANQVLLFHGKQGAGKSTLMSMVAHRLLEDYRRDPDVAVVDLFFRAGGSPELKSRDLVLRAILWQLCQRHPRLASTIRHLDHLTQDIGARLRSSDLLDAILAAFGCFRKVFLVFDGIDEFGSSPGDITALLILLRKLQTAPQSNLLVASLDQPDIMEGLEKWPRVEVRASAEDICRYFQDDESFPPNPRLLDNGHWAGIIRVVTMMSSGSFLAASFLRRVLAHMDSEKEFCGLIRTIMEGNTSQEAYDASSVLQETFNYLLKKIEHNSRARTRGKMVILWVLLARWPLSTEELCHAIDSAGRIAIERLLQDSHGFVTLGLGRSGKARIVSMSHAFIRTHMIRAWDNELPGAHAEIAGVLLKSLSTSVQHTGIHAYAAQHWAAHVSEASTNGSLLPSAIGFLRNKENVAKACPMFLVGSPKSISGCHLAAHFGLRNYLAELVKDEGLDQRDDQGATPLMWAARNCQEEVVNMLLDLGSDVDVDVHDAHLKTPLHYATKGQWDRALRILLERKASVSVDSENMTALHYAVCSGWEEGIRYFIEAGWDIDVPIQRRADELDVQDGRYFYCRQELGPETEPDLCTEPRTNLGLTPLHFAALCGNNRMVHFLLDLGANPGAVSEYGETPLHLAISQRLKQLAGHSGLMDCWTDERERIESFVERTLDMEDNEFISLRHWIADKRYNIVKTLLQHPRTDVNEHTTDGSQSLHSLPYDHPSGTALAGRIAKLLLDHGAEVSGRDGNGATPLLIACRHSHVGVARLLLKRGAEVSETDWEGCNALHYAAMSSDASSLDMMIRKIYKLRRRHMFMSRDVHGRNILHHYLAKQFPDSPKRLQRLLKLGCDVNAVDENGLTPLMICLRRNFLGCPTQTQVIRTCLKWGVDATYRSPGDSWTLGHHYSQVLFPETEGFKLLLGYGVDLAAVDANGRTILHCAAEQGSLTEPVLEFLLGDDVGLSLDTLDSDGNTPLECAVVERRSIKCSPRYRDMFKNKRWDNVVDLLQAWAVRRADAGTPDPSSVPGVVS